MGNPYWDKYAPPPQRYVILGDDSGHSYFVPVDQVEDFESWVQYTEDGEADEYRGPDFEANRIDGRFTFTDPQNV